MTIDSLRHFPLGQRVPLSEHAVCVSLPTLADVIGYEEKDSHVMAKVQSGYPRFVVHKFVKKMVDELLNKKNLGDRAGFAVTSETAGQELVEFLDSTDFSIEQREEFSLVHGPDSEEVRALGKSFLQHTGLSVSSRQAEDFLTAEGLLGKKVERVEDTDAGGVIGRELSGALGTEISSLDIIPATSGANAFYGLFRTARKVLAAQGRTIWIQLGWLYVDTIKVLEKFTDGNDKIVTIFEVGDLSEVRKLFAERGSEIAAIVTETPTNPLLQTCDLDELRDLCRTSGAMLVVDPTMSSPRNVKVAGHADVIVNSLTKYTANEGDVMLGCLAFPKSSPFRETLLEPTRRRIAAPYRRDLARLAHDYPQLVEQTNLNLMRLAEFLGGHPAVKKLHWAYSEPFRANYEKLAGAERPGCVLAFETKVPIKEFYDKVRLLKSPSFGTKFSMLCPYVYLAHYEMLQDETGLKTLAKAGLEPELIRVSVGIEPADEIIDVFKEALET